MNGEVEAGTPVDTGAGHAPIEGAPVGAVPSTFAEMGLRPEVLQALTEMGFLDPMPVQRAVYARMMAGRDVLVQSRTGSGKTAAFGIPFAQGPSIPTLKKVQALVLAPTRELAMQVANECGADRSVPRARGGADLRRRADGRSRSMRSRRARTSSPARRGGCSITCGAARSSSTGVKVLVLDEADEMLSMGFLEEITEIIKRCPPKEARQTLAVLGDHPRGHRAHRLALHAGAGEDLALGATSSARARSSTPTTW